MDALGRLGERLGGGLAAHLDRVADLPGQPMILLHNGIHGIRCTETMVVSVRAMTPVSMRWRVSDVPPM